MTIQDQPEWMSINLRISRNGSLMAPSPRVGRVWFWSEGDQFKVLCAGGTGRGLSLAQGREVGEEICQFLL